MALLQPRDIFRVLGADGVKYVVIGNLGGTLYGSPLVTNDLDVCPSREDANLVALATALIEMGARIRTGGTPEGLPFACDTVFLRRMKIVNLTTRFGDLDLSFEPSGHAPYPFGTTTHWRFRTVEPRVLLTLTRSSRGRPSRSSVAGSTPSR